MEQIGNPLTFNCQYLNTSGAGQTGLTVVVDIYRNGTLILNDQAVTEIGGGIYAYTLASGSVTVEGVYLAQFSNATWGVITDRIAVGLGGIENLDVATSTRLATSSYTAPDNAGILAAIAALPSASTIASAVWAAGTRTLTSFGTLVADVWSYATRTLTGFTVALQSPLDPDDLALNLYSGDDYYTADGRSPSFTITGYDLAGSTPVLKTKWFTITGTVSGSTVTFEIPRTSTDLSQRSGDYEVEITLSNGHIITPVTGMVTISKRLS